MFIDTEIEYCEVKDTKGNVLMRFNNNPSITFTLDETNTVLDAVEPVQPQASAHEAGEALRKVFISLTKANGEFKKASDVLSELADKWSEIGNINPITPDEVAQGLLRAQTPDTTVTQMKMRFAIFWNKMPMMKIFIFN